MINTKINLVNEDLMTILEQVIFTKRPLLIIGADPKKKP
jgi:hypothetical protein